jgi:hypothetical protein
VPTRALNFVARFCIYSTRLGPGGSEFKCGCSRNVYIHFSERHFFL